MSTVRQHLMKAHEISASNHRELAKCHATAMGKAVAGDSMHEFHKNAMAAHEVAAEQHDALCQECEKSIQSDLQKLVPTRVSAVAPTPPVRAVPRYGQREIPLADTVDPIFRKLVLVDEDEQL